MSRRYFTSELFSFLNDLARHNDREWFKANQARYEEHVREPALEFITDFGERLAAISPNFVADSRKVGGSLFRIQRDTRFAKDKTPYKTNTGMHFRHVRAKDAHAPGFYVHLEPRASFAGVGIWGPDSASATKIRRAIVDDPTGWRKAAYGKRFSDIYAMDDHGDKLKRPPRGFDPDHRYIEDLKRRHFLGSTKLTQARISGGGFLDDYTAMCRRAAPFMQFLCAAVEVPF